LSCGEAKAVGRTRENPFLRQRTKKKEKRKRHRGGEREEKKDVVGGKASFLGGNETAPKGAVVVGR
jgi:hypothetical protein